MLLIFIITIILFYFFIIYFIYFIFFCYISQTLSDRFSQVNVVSECLAYRYIYMFNVYIFMLPLAYERKVPPNL